MTETTEPEVPEAMTELQEKLTGAEGALARRALKSRMESLAAAVETQVEAGMSPEAYADAQKALAALRTAAGMLG
ncbi:MAG: hypothetical protein AAFN17_13400 [Pseudomonadota bacterium]